MHGCSEESSSSSESFSYSDWSSPLPSESEEVVDGVLDVVDVDDNVIRRGHNLLEPQEAIEDDYSMPEVQELIDYLKEHPEARLPPERQEEEEEEEEASEDVILIPRAPETIKIRFFGRCGRLEDFYPPFKGARSRQDIEDVIEANYQAGPGNHLSPVDFARLDFFVCVVSDIFDQLEEDRWAFF